MPYIRVTIDGEILASIATDGWEVVGVNVGGARVHQEYASVNASAGAYPVNSAAEYRIWIDQRPLLPGQRVEVALLESDLPIGDGKTIAELYPSTVSESSAHSADSAAAFDELRSMTTVRDQYTLELTTSQGVMQNLVTELGEHGFGFGFTWNSHHPARASARLGAYAIDSLERREPGRTCFREHVAVGTHVTLALIG